MREHADTFVAMQQSAETRTAYRKDLDRWFRYHDGVGVTTSDALGFRGYLGALELAVNSQARVWSTTKSFHRYLVQTAALDKSPFEYIKGPKRPTNVSPKVPTDDEVAELVGAAASVPQRALIVALLLNGLRASEVADLKQSDVEEHEGAVILRVHGKGEKERLVPATVETQQAIRRYFGGNDLPRTAFLVSDYDGSRLTLRQVQHAVYKSAGYAGVENMHPHALRHHYATRLIRAGASVLHVKDLLGHASVNTTQVYVRLDVADLIKASQLDPRNQQAPTAVEDVA